MFQLVRVWKVICEKCGGVFCTDGNQEDYFHTQKEAREIITDEGWHLRNGKIYCNECFVY